MKYALTSFGFLLKLLLNVLFLPLHCTLALGSFLAYAEASHDILKRACRCFVVHIGIGIVGRFLTTFGTAIAQKEAH